MFSKKWGYVLLSLIIIFGVSPVFLPVQALPKISLGVKGGLFYFAPLANQPSSLSYNYELPELRAEYSKTYQKDDGSFALVSSIGPMHYKDNYANPYEQWKDIDLTIVNGKITKAPYDLTIDGNIVTVRDKRTGSIVALNLFKIKNKNISKMNYVYKGNKATALEVDIDLDVVIEATSTEVKFKRVLKSKKASSDASFGFSKYGDGLKVKYYASDKKGKKLPVTTTEESGILTEVVNPVYLDDAEFPVVIDPIVTVTVTASTDDCHVIWNGAAWSLDLVSVQQSAGYFGAGTERVGGGMRFLNVAIPANVTVNAAYFNITCFTGLAGNNCNSNITGEQSITPNTFVNITDYQARTHTTAMVNWDAIGAWVGNTTYQSPDISSIITEIITLPGWVSNNNMVIFWDDHDDRSTHVANAMRQGFSYNSASSSDRPLLYIDYSTNAPIVTTIGAINVEETTATTGGNCTIIGTNNVTTWGTQYGTIPAYGSWVNNTGNEGSPFAWTDALIGLNQGDLYYFRAFAESLSGFGTGVQDTFLTKPSEPTNFVCNPFNTTAVMVNWTDGIGRTTTYTRYQVASCPANTTQGTLGYNDTASYYIQDSLTSGITYFFSGWSWASEGGALTQYSDNYSCCSSSPITAPTITTLRCTGWGRDWAILNGRLDGAGTPVATDFGFDYGPDTSYGSNITTPSETPGEGDSWWILLTGLTPSTTYHFRAFAGSTIYGYGSDLWFTTEPSCSTYESFTSGDNTTSQLISAGNMTFQTFTTGSFAHSVQKIKLMLYRTGTPDTVTVSIFDTNAGIPVGEALGSGSLDGDFFSTWAAWETFTMDSEIWLEQSTQYAILIKAEHGDGTNYIYWRGDGTSSYTGGNSGYSVNGGISWTSDPLDLMFDICGNPAIDVDDAKVFMGFLETGDWLITTLYKNYYPPYFDGYDVSTYFDIQLIDYNVTEAQVSCRMWGYVPGAIYLATDEVASLEWGATDYKVRVIGSLVTGTPYMEFVLTAEHWRGINLDELDSWCLLAAGQITDYTGAVLTSYVADRGEVLDDAGGVLFESNVPGLMYVRPDLFKTTAFSLRTSGVGTPTTYAPAWQTVLGSYFTQSFTQMGNLVSVPGKVFGGVSWLFLAFCFGVFGVVRGHAMVVLAVILSFIPIGVWLGLVIVQILLVLVVFFALFLAWQIFFKGA